MNNEERKIFVSNLGNPYTNPCSNKLKLLFNYISKENDIIKQFDMEDGIDTEAEAYIPDGVMIERLNDMEEYRIARTIFIYVQQMMSNGNLPRDKNYIKRLDEEQRRKHNKALISLLGFNEFAEQHELEKFYTGKQVNKSDIKDLGTGDIEARAEMTNFFLSLLNELSEYNIKELDNKTVRKQMKEVQDKINSTNKDYKIKKPFSNYNENVEFYK